MGSKPPKNLQSDRPESGGANRDDSLEKSGLLERDEQQVAKSNKEKARQRPAPSPEAEDQADGSESTE
jgi:hypothetical protein